MGLDQRAARPDAPPRQHQRLEKAVPPGSAGGEGWHPRRSGRSPARSPAPGPARRAGRRYVIFVRCSRRSSAIAPRARSRERRVVEAAPWRAAFSRSDGVEGVEMHPAPVRDGAPRGGPPPARPGRTERRKTRPPPAGSERRGARPWPRPVRVGERPQTPTRSAPTGPVPAAPRNPRGRGCAGPGTGSESAVETQSRAGPSGMSVAGPGAA